MYQKIFKRLIDFTMSAIAIVMLSPLLIILSVAIKLTSKGPVLFKQTRIGRGNSEFTILKFRTMRYDTPSNIPTHLLENPNSHITGVGKFLRASSLDELPQLFNILSGDMSIIGPRPSLPTQFDLNKLRDENGASLIKPGLTGLAQIRGRDELPIVQKANYDGEYAKQVTFSNDVKLFFGTITSVLKSDGVKEGKL